MRLLLVFQLFIISFFSFSQIAVGEWRDHLPYTKALSLVEGNNKIYCSTESAIFIYNKEDNSLSKLSKVDGLSDVGITCINYNSTNDLLVIGYSNGNIDLIKSKLIINVSDIKRKLIPGIKSINNIFFIGTTAYLSTGFGIVVLDTENEEIKDTYYIGSLGEKIIVNEITSNGTFLYAATEYGIYKASLDEPFLADYNNWSLLTNIPNYSSNFSTITYLSDKLFFSGHIEKYSSDSLYYLDTMYTYNIIDDTWDYLLPDVDFTTIYKIDANDNWVLKSKDYKIYSTNTCNENVIIADGNRIFTSDETLNYNSTESFNGIGSLKIRNAILDSDNRLWFADNNNGLVKKNDSGTFESKYINGPLNPDAFQISTSNNNLWVASGGINGSWVNLWTHPTEVYSFIDEVWSTKNAANSSGLAGVPNIIRVLISPSDNQRVYLGSWGGGVIEFYNGVFSVQYDQYNSSLQSIYPTSKYCRIGGLAIDNEDNLWITNGGVPNPISVKTPDNEWYSFPYGSEIDALDLSYIIVTKTGDKWVVIPRGGGLFAFNENETFDNNDDDETKAFSIMDENATIISNDIFSIAEDHDGIIWVGTNKGIVAYYYPENIFSGENFYAQRILIPSEVEGQANYLLENETVTAIEIDGSNKKWLGTESSGAYLMSEDMSEEIYHFTIENSPLVSNNIMSISINQSTGEIFFGTEKGIVSFRGTATQGSENNEDVYVYPNPVREDYEGLITITGLVTNSNVKITDIAGNIVYETTAEGGQATWDGKNFSGSKVKTGVYLAFVSNEDGSKTTITKILFIN